MGSVTLYVMVTSRVIIKGRIERKEFQEPFRQCTETLEQIGVQYCVNPAITGEPADFALFFQSYPHEFLKTELTRLRRENPFVPFFFVLGVCCEGMLRTAGPLDSPFYCYVHRWSGRETEQICQFLTDQPSMFSLPLTAEQDEIVQWQNPVELTSPLPFGERVRVRGEPVEKHTVLTPARVCKDLIEGEGTTQKCLILTHFGPFGNDSAMNQLIADEQKRLGYAPVFSGKTLPEAFEGKILADADDSPPEKILESLQRFRHRFADNDFTVYIDSPRINEENDYIRAGATRILPKMR